MDKCILIADNHWTTVDGIRLFLRENLDLPIVDSATKCSEIAKMLRTKEYTHLLMELYLEDDTSASIIPEIKDHYPSLNIAIFTAANDLIKGPLRDYGIYHFISKELSKDEIEKACTRFFENQLSLDSLRRFSKNTQKLSPRELQVYALLLAKIPNDEIANRLNVKKNSISTFRYRILRKS